MRIIPAYLFIFIIMGLTLALLPKQGGFIWQPEFIVTLSALLFTLLVYLVGHIAHTNKTTTGIIGTAVFILLFCPESYKFFYRDEIAIMELFSICIVPFFISQYNRISTKDFKYGYFLMLLMGIFCSYTHDSITIPLCLSFLMLPYVQRERLFRLACWPMVIGFVIGTTLAILKSAYFNSAIFHNWHMLSCHTTDGLTQLWETKVFIFAVLTTIYFLISKQRRTLLLHIFHHQKLLTYCLLFSFCAIPFAPLGLDNAISGVSFFCMFWVLILCHYLMEQFRNRHIRKTSQSNEMETPNH